MKSLLIVMACVALVNELAQAASFSKRDFMVFESEDEINSERQDNEARRIGTVMMTKQKVDSPIAQSDKSPRNEQSHLADEIDGPIIDQQKEASLDNKGSSERVSKESDRRQVVVTMSPVEEVTLSNDFKGLLNELEKQAGIVTGVAKDGNRAGIKNQVSEKSCACCKSLKRASRSLRDTCHTCTNCSNCTNSYTMVSCQDCDNCDTCTRCKSCTGSKTCVDCGNCGSSDTCTNCTGCTGCHTCVGCQGCSACHTCTGCSNVKGGDTCVGCQQCENCKTCTGCKNCTGCHTCTNCVDCHNVRNCNGKVGLRDCSC